MRIWRRLLSSVNLLVTLACLFALFILVNYTASRRYARVDCTKTKRSVLSDKTVSVLKGLTEPVSVVVFYQPMKDEKHAEPLYPLITDLVREYERFTDQLTVEFVDPFQDLARAQQLAQQFEIAQVNLVIVHAGTRHKYLSDTDLVEYDYSSMSFGAAPRVRAFKGEDALTSAILGVTQATSPLIWVTTGHGEKDLESQEAAGIAGLKKALEQQNLSVQAVTLAEHVTVPVEVKVVVIAGPTRRFSESEVTLLGAFLDQGGRVLVLTDPLMDTGLEALLQRWGVVLSQDIVVDPRAQLQFISAANLLIATYTEHPIVAKMKTLLTMFPLARSVRPADPAPQDMTITPLAMTSPDGWGETHTSSETFQLDDQDTKGPVPVAVAVERERPTETRLVVIGDSEFVMNAQLANAGNKDFLLGAVFWLTQQEHLIGIGPKTLESVKLHLTSRQTTGIFWFSFLGLPSACGLLGALMWWVRRT
ncbi:MAG: GldG family protein [Candidatus Omnitrophica bacterium]|nr:GldG family protein [Candidatus Omnitrophota bacterium]